jgi:hypothetical protein
MNELHAELAGFHRQLDSSNRRERSFEDSLMCSRRRFVGTVAHTAGEAKFQASLRWKRDKASSV